MLRAPDLNLRLHVEARQPRHPAYRAHANPELTRDRQRPSASRPLSLDGARDRALDVGWFGGVGLGRRPARPSISWRLEGARGRKSGAKRYRRPGRDALIGLGRGRGRRGRYPAREFEKIVEMISDLTGRAAERTKGSARSRTIACGVAKWPGFPVVARAFHVGLGQGKAGAVEGRAAGAVIGRSWRGGGGKGGRRGAGGIRKAGARRVAPLGIRGGRGRDSARGLDKITNVVDHGRRAAPWRGRAGHACAAWLGR